MINRFALVAATLRMAIDVGLLPWTADDTDLGIAACMVRWAANRKGRLDLAGETVSAVEQIREILTANLHGRFIHLRIAEDGKLNYAKFPTRTSGTLSVTLRPDPRRANSVAVGALRRVRSGKNGSPLAGRRSASCRGRQASRSGEGYSRRIICEGPVLCLGYENS